MQKVFVKALKRSVDVL